MGCEDRISVQVISYLVNQRSTIKSLYNPCTNSQLGNNWLFRMQSCIALTFRQILVLYSGEVICKQLMTYAIRIDCEWYMSKSIEVNTENIIKGLMHVKVNIVCWHKWCLYFVWLQNRPVRTKPFFSPDIFLASLTPLQDWFSPNIRGLFCETKKKTPKTIHSFSPNR